VRLSARLALVFGVIGFVTVTGVSTLAWWFAAAESAQSVDDSLVERIEPIGALAQRAVADADQIADELAEARARGETPITATDDFNAQADETTIRILLADGSISGSPDAPATDDAFASLADPDIHLESVTIDGTPYRVATVPIGEWPTIDDPDTPAIGLQLAQDVSSEAAALSGLATRLVVLSIAGVLVVAAASWLVGRRLTRPINELTHTAERLAELDDLPGRVEVRRDDEIGRLAASYNRLMSALEVGREQQRRLVADASHELRTPLTALRARVEYLERRGGHDDETAAMLRAAVHDTERLSALVSDLVDLAVDVRNADEDPEPVRLGDLVADVATHAEVSTGRAIHVDSDDTVAVVRPTMVRRALHNLLDNAVKYGGDGEILVRSRAGAIEVHDDGLGIAPDDRAHVFDRFYRSPKARNRPGNGIGLAIVEQVATAHDGTVWVASSDRGGAVVGFSVRPDAVAAAVEPTALVAGR
jgi:two-component system sensor histidine kinase MprB